MRYLFDTNICIHLIQHQPVRLVQRCEALAYGDGVISSIVLAELRHGVERDPAVRDRAEFALEAMLRFFPVVPFDEAAARCYGVMVAAAPDKRRNALDKLIAAHTLSLGLTLVTNNAADFRHFAGLRVENWIANE